MEFDTVEVYQSGMKADGSAVYTIEGPTFKAESGDIINLILKGVPNLMIEQDKGGWETYGVVTFGDHVIFMLKREAAKILVPPSVAFRVK